MLWELYQQTKIAGASTEARSAREAVGAASGRIERLEQRIDQLVLINMAMWEILREDLKITEEELILRVQEIDLRDGVRDGKARLDVEDCAKCKRKISTKHNRCLYCGAEGPNPSAFKAVI